MRRKTPRPPSVTIFCGLLTCFSSLNLLQGIFQMNNGLYETAIGLVLLHVFTAPVIALNSALFMLRGRNWARQVFWFVYSPFAVWLVIDDVNPQTHDPNPQTIVRVCICAVGIVLTALPNANWFFTGRDYLKRLAAKGAKRVRERALAPAPAQRSGRSSEYRY